MGNVQLGRRIYESLLLQRREIEGELGSNPLWDSGENNSETSVTLNVEGSISDPPERLDEIRAWMLETLPKLRDVFNPRLEKILAELEEA